MSLFNAYIQFLTAQSRHYSMKPYHLLNYVAKMNIWRIRTVILGVICTRARSRFAHFAKGTKCGFVLLCFFAQNEKKQLFFINHMMFRRLFATLKVSSRCFFFRTWDRKNVHEKRKIIKIETFSLFLLGINCLCSWKILLFFLFFTEKIF